MKASGDQMDDRIVEVCWDTERGTWKILRIRDDKPYPNHRSIMQKIIVSIEDGVEIEAVSLISPLIHQFVPSLIVNVLLSLVVITE